jgi:YjbE family integral membrane protein
MEHLLTGEALTALLQVIMIDLVLAGDNAIVIGLAAAGLPKEQRGKAILIGIAAATVLRILFALVTTQLLAIVGLLLAGGVLLLWVCWKMWRELRHSAKEDHQAEEALAGQDANGNGAPRKTFAQAAWQIVIADVSMSLDNVLAVAGAAREHPVHRQAAEPPPLDRLCRPGDHPLRRHRHDLARLGGGVAAPAGRDVRHGLSLV